MIKTDCRVRSRKIAKIFEMFTSVVFDLVLLHEADESKSLRRWKRRNDRTLEAESPSRGSAVRHIPRKIPNARCILRRRRRRRPSKFGQINLALRSTPFFLSSSRALHPRDRPAAGARTCAHACVHTCMRMHAEDAREHVRVVSPLRLP